MLIAVTRLMPPVRRSQDVDPVPFLRVLCLTGSSRVELKTDRHLSVSWTCGIWGAPPRARNAGPYGDPRPDAPGGASCWRAAVWTLRLGGRGSDPDGFSRRQQC